MCLTAAGTPLAAQEAQPSSEQRDDHSRARPLVFLGGAATALALHEAGHLTFDVAFAARPRLKGVKFAGIPFFAIAHDPVSRRREFAISSAGFWVQHGTDEWLLTRRPHLREEAAPFAKGVLAFNVLSSVAYSAVAFARAGPAERDTRGIAASLGRDGVDEPWAGVLVLAPAALDAFRYFAPESRWAPWASRAVKVGMVLLILR